MPFFLSFFWKSTRMPLSSKHLLIFKTSSSRLQDMSWRRLQHVFNVIIFRLPRRLAEISQAVLKTSWRRLERQKIVMLKTFQDILNTCLKDVLNTCLQHVLKIFIEDVLKTCLEDVFRGSCRETKALLGMFVSKKSKCVSNKSIFPKSISDETKTNSIILKLEQHLYFKN